MGKQEGGKDPPPKVPRRVGALCELGGASRKEAELRAPGGGALLSEAPSVEKGQWFWQSGGVSVWNSPSAVRHRTGSDPSAALLLFLVDVRVSCSIKGQRGVDVLGHQREMVPFKCP